MHKLTKNQYLDLKQHGCLTLNNFFNLEEVSRFKKISNLILDNFQNLDFLSKCNGRHEKENEKYSSVSASNQMIISDRRNNKIDNGMIDIFNPHLANLQPYDMSNNLNLFMKKINECIVSQINLYSNSKKMSLRNTNLYQHYKTTRPRPAHFDNVDTYYKVFLYLTDVESSNGAFYYYPKSHKLKFRKKIISFVNYNLFNLKNGRDTDINFLYRNKLKINLTGKIGTLVVCDVAGFHGSNKFIGDYKREVLVQCVR